MKKYAKASSKREKRNLVSAIVARLLRSGARFVKHDRESGKWYDIGKLQAHEKTGHAIRDHIINRSKKQAHKRSGTAITVKAKTTKKEEARLSTRSSSLAIPKATAFTENVHKQTEKTAQQTNPHPALGLAKSIEPTSSHTVTRGFFFDSENQSMVSDYADRLMKEQIVAIMHYDLFSGLSKPFLTHDLSIQEVLEVCSLLAEPENYADSFESPISSDLPDDWL
jgi:hypothetical protein